MEANVTNKKIISSTMAAILSAIFPGLGQIFIGEWRRGLTLLLGLPAQAGLLYGVKMPYLAYWLLAIWAWNTYDASVLAKGKRASGIGPIFLILLVNIIAACKVTDVHIPELAPQQKGVIHEIVTGLAKPDFFEPRVKIQKASAGYYVGGRSQVDLPQNSPLSEGHLSLSIKPLVAKENDMMTVEGRGFQPNSKGKLVLIGTAELTLCDIQTDSKGRFKSHFTNPRSLPGKYFVQARVETPQGSWKLSETLETAAPRMFETIYLALMGTALSLIFAIPLSFFGARNLMSGSAMLKVIYGLTRALFTALRSVEVLIIAVIAVAAVGIGPFAGVIALAIHGVGALGKLYSESIESIDSGPIEAIRATGATESQVVMFGVVPQVVPQFIAFTLYRWDINVRMATVIGLVGGGGIGDQLLQYMQLLQWKQAATAIWLIAGVVMLMDYASAVIREKVV